MPEKKYEVKKCLSKTSLSCLTPVLLSICMVMWEEDQGWDRTEGLVGNHQGAPPHTPLHESGSETGCVWRLKGPWKPGWRLQNRPCRWKD